VYVQPINIYWILLVTSWNLSVTLPPKSGRQKPEPQMVPEAPVAWQIPVLSVLFLIEKFVSQIPQVQ
jgi:hypothetical protein